MGESSGSKLRMGEPETPLFSEDSGKGGGPLPQWFNLVCSAKRKVAIGVGDDDGDGNGDTGMV